MSEGAEGAGGVLLLPLGVQVLSVATAVVVVAAAAADCWRGGLVQRFAAVPFLIQAALAALHHVNKVSQCLLLVHRNIPEVTAHRLQKGRKREEVKRRA